jgi:hypothetical protein
VIEEAGPATDASDFGSSLFKVHSGRATYADILSVLSPIATSAPVRARCGSLGTLVGDMARSVRASHCFSMITIFLVEYRPADVTTHLCGDDYPLRPLRPREDLHMAFPRQWEAHVRSTSVGRGVGGTLWEVLFAIEDLWGVPGEFVVRPDRSAW